MSENCLKCKKAIGKDGLIACSTENCQRKYHRNCVNVSDVLYEQIQQNPLVTFNCDECRTQSTKVLANKLTSLDEKVNKINNHINQMQSRLNIQLLQHGSVSDGRNKTMLSSLVVMGNNCNSNKLQVICDYGHWVQVGKFATSTTEEDIIDHLGDVLKINKNLIKCTKLVRNDANLAKLSYCKFKISIPEYRFNELYNEAIWPSGVMVSPFTPRSQLSSNRI